MRRLLALFAILFALSFHNVTLAQQDCQEVDCTGLCGRFVDNDQDGYCDHGFLSEPVVEEAQNGDVKKTLVITAAVLAVAAATGVTFVALRKKKNKNY